MLVLIWIQTVSHSDSVPESSFEQVNLKKKMDSLYALPH